MKKLFLALSIACLSAGLIGCQPRSDVFPNAKEMITFSKPIVVELPENSSYAEKRKFIDLNGDGIEDMLEVNDTAFFGQDYKAHVFLGYKNPQGYLQFSAESKYTIDINMDSSWASSLTKIDAADVNGDGYGDLVFTEYKQSFTGESYIAKVALNQQDGKTFKYATDIANDKYPLETIILNAIALLSDSYGTEGEKVSDYLALDWADSNNDGRDDLMIFWKDGRNLHVTTLISGEVSDPTSQFSFSGNISDPLSNFMYGDKGANFKPLNIDTEDFNGDGQADILLHRRSGSMVTLNAALSQQPNGTYAVNAQYKGQGADLDFWSFEKVDTFDANFDGCADYVHLGVLEEPGKPDRKVASYKLSSCPK